MEHVYLHCDSCQLDTGFNLNAYVTKCDDFIERIPLNYEIHIWINNCIHCKNRFLEYQVKIASMRPGTYYMFWAYIRLSKVVCISTIYNNDYILNYGRYILSKNVIIGCTNEEFLKNIKQGTLIDIYDTTIPYILELQQQISKMSLKFTKIESFNRMYIVDKISLTKRAI